MLPVLALVQLLNNRPPLEELGQDERVTILGHVEKRCVLLAK
jgi:hypothetical protein